MSTIYREGGYPRMGLVLTDGLVGLRVSLLCGIVGGAGGGESENSENSPLSGPQQHEGTVCVCKTTKTPAGDMVQGHGTSLGDTFILHVRFHAHTLTGVGAEVI